MKNWEEERQMETAFPLKSLCAAGERWVHSLLRVVFSPVMGEMSSGGVQHKEVPSGTV